MTYGVNAPLGLQAATYGNSAPWSGGLQVFNINLNYGTGLYLGDLVSLVNGYVIQYNPANQATVPAQGVFWGCTFTDPSGIVQIQKYWPAAQAVKAGTFPVANVITDTNTVFTIQSTAAYAWADIGKNANVSLATPGSAATGYSGMQLNQGSLATTTTLPLHVISFDTFPGNAPAPGGTSAPFANLFVKLNNSSFSAGAIGEV